jgi:hypothetical protein
MLHRLRVLRCSAEVAYVASKAELESLVAFVLFSPKEKG